MGADTGIEWADDTFNPWVGCAKVGPGCDNCYAEAWARRTGAPGLWNGERRRTQTWRDPIKWDREARAAGIRRRVFCASLADVFDNAVPDAWRADLWNLVRTTPHLDWIIVTKRIGNAAGMLPADWGRGWPHVWLLATVCNQAEADRDIRKLLDTPAAVRGISYEPALGPVNISRYFPRDYAYCELLRHYYTGEFRDPGPDVPPAPREGIKGLDWVICGGESGPRARPMHPSWARSARDQCQSAGVAFFFKQWGEWAPQGLNELTRRELRMAVTPGAEAWPMRRVGKKTAGHLLDGREWLEFPGP